MRLALLCAMDDESRALFDEFSLTKWGDFYTGRVGELELAVGLSGIGKVNAAIAAQKIIDAHQPDLVYFSGVAGAVSEELRRGDVVIATFLIQHDFDLTAFGYDRGVVPNTDCSVDDDYTMQLMEASKQAGFDVKMGGMLSGDIFMEKLDSKKKLGKRYQALCCDMESAAAAVACTSSSVPFVCSRIISDDISDNADDYSENEEELSVLSSRVSANFVKYLSRSAE